MVTYYIAAVAGWITVLLLIMGGTECQGIINVQNETDPVHTQDTGCQDKVSECQGIINFQNQFARTGGRQLLDVCRAILENLTQCVESAKPSCSGQNELQTQLNNMKIECSLNTICMTEHSKCMMSAPVTRQNGGSAKPNMVEVIGKCGLYRGVWNCLKAMDGRCLTVEAVKKSVSGVENMTSLCRGFTNEMVLFGSNNNNNNNNKKEAIGNMIYNGSCFDAASCFTMALATNTDSCSLFLSMMGCLSEKSQYANCSLDQTKITHAKVRKEAIGICKVSEQRCPASERCIMKKEEMLSGPSAKGGSAPDTMDYKSTFFVNFTNPAMYCNVMIASGKCFVDRKQGCGYSSDDMDNLESALKRLKEQCPTGDISNGPRQTLPGVLFCVTVLLSVWVFPWPSLY